VIGRVSTGLESLVVVFFCLLLFVNVCCLLFCLLLFFVVFCFVFSLLLLFCFVCCNCLLLLFLICFVFFFLFCLVLFSASFVVAQKTISHQQSLTESEPGPQILLRSRRDMTIEEQTGSGVVTEGAGGEYILGRCLRPLV
jgi:hypothetical protein